MYTLSKLVWLVLEPSNFLVFLVLAGIGLTFTRALRAGRVLVLTGGIGLCVAGFAPLGTALMRPLETAFPPLVEEGQVDGIVVLGGALVTDVSMARGQLSINEAGERLTALAGLARRHPNAAIVFTGGAGDFTGSAIAEADALERVIGELLPDRAIRYERLSRNTRENAQNSYRLARPRPGSRWLLVTSAWHMPRALGLFRKAGWSVTPYPVDFRSSGTPDDWRPNAAISLGLRRVDVATKEWLGLLFAVLVGHSEQLWPKP